MPKFCFLLLLPAAVVSLCSAVYFESFGSSVVLLDCVVVSETRPGEMSSAGACLTLRATQQRKSDIRFVTFNSTDLLCSFMKWCSRAEFTSQPTSVVVFVASDALPLRHCVFAFSIKDDANAYQEFNRDVSNSDFQLLSKSMTPAVTPWKSAWLQNLAKLIEYFKYITVEVLVKSETVLSLTFKLTGQTSQSSWFTKSHLVSSKPDLGLSSRTFQAFSIEGMNSGDHQRHFYIVTVHNGCENDAGLLAVFENPDTCSYTSRKRIAYNLNMTAWLSNAEDADFLLLHVHN